MPRSLNVCQRLVQDVAGIRIGDEVVRVRERPRQEATPVADLRVKCIAYPLVRQLQRKKPRKRQRFSIGGLCPTGTVFAAGPAALWHPTGP